jgi:hypothetical protein
MLKNTSNVYNFNYRIIWFLRKYTHSIGTKIVKVSMDDWKMDIFSFSVGQLCYIYTFYNGQILALKEK